MSSIILVLIAAVAGGIVAWLVVSAKSSAVERGSALADLVTPIKEGLEKYDRKIAEIEIERAKSFGALNERLESLLTANTQLRAETQALAGSLRSTTIRGRWGEIALKRVAELAGMLDHCDFTTQETTDGDAGRQRPDMVVNLSGGRCIAVDAKVPLDAYLAAMECEKESDRIAHLKRHAAQVRLHAKKLGEKAYWNQLDGSPDAVVMFLPGEVYFAAALQSDASLLEEISGDKVILASPTTLIALLKSCAYGWREEKLRENAEEIAALGRELHQRMTVLAEHVGRIGKSLGDSVKAYNDAVGSIESRVMVTGRKFRDLGGLTDGEIPALVPIERIARELTATATDKELDASRQLIS
jgi:DNA recombination protein RmuC